MNERLNQKLNSIETRDFGDWSKCLVSALTHDSFLFYFRVKQQNVVIFQIKDLTQLLTPKTKHRIPRKLIDSDHFSKSDGVSQRCLCGLWPLRPSAALFEELSTWKIHLCPSSSVASPPSFCFHHICSAHTHVGVRLCACVCLFILATKICMQGKDTWAGPHNFQGLFKG